jgi:shikimate dehydrogenase
VTLPFKTEAWALCARRSARAERAGAVNTLWFDTDGRLQGDNTDGAGLVTDMVANQGWQVRDRDVLLLGAGGAARGVIPALIAQQPHSLFIANRSADKAVELAAVFADAGRVQGGGFSEATDPFDIIINATSASLKGEVPPVSASVLRADAVCYDMMYGREPTPFMRWAAANGARQCIDGLGMLVEQAAEAFEIWRGIRPETAPVLAFLRSVSG